MSHVYVCPRPSTRRFMQSGDGEQIRIVCVGPDLSGILGGINGHVDEQHPETEIVDQSK